MIFALIRGLLAGGPYYLRISRERVSVRNVSTGDRVEVTAKLGLDGSGTVLSVGDPVDPGAVRVLTPFQHPRMLISDFNSGEKVVQYAIRKLVGRGPLAPSPVVVAHPDIELEGGLTHIEARALRELVQSAGARKVYLHYGRQLADQEVANLSFDDFDKMDF